MDEHGCHPVVWSKSRFVAGVFTQRFGNTNLTRQVSMIEPDEIKKLDSGFSLILIIWGAIFASLGVYLGVSLFIADTLTAAVGDKFPLVTLRYALFGISAATLVAVHFLRGFMLGHPGAVKNLRSMPSAQHPAVARYSVIVIVTSALLESIGIYGLVLFLLAKDALSFYQLLGVAAVAMLVYRPKKEELLALARRMDTMG